MRTVVSCLLAVMVAALTFAGVASGQPKPQFKLGFQALADQIPNVVGEPTEEEHYGPNGDSLQITTTGLMAWRKADNWTAFTDGARTWINGPAGVQDRPNQERFDWEADAPGAATGPEGEKPAPGPTVAPRVGATPQAGRPTVTPQPARATAMPTPSAAYTAQVKAMDEQAATQGGWISDFVRSLGDEWANSWGWRPNQPTTFYLFSDGAWMQSSFASLVGRAPSQGEMAGLSVSQSWTVQTQVQPRGWAILVNLSKLGPARTFQSNVRQAMVGLYANRMVAEVGGSNVPAWYRTGLGELLAFQKTPELLVDDVRVKAVARWNAQGSLPPLRELHQNWAGINDPGGGRDSTYGMAYLAVSYLAERVGGTPLIEVLKKMRAGAGFEAALQEATGYTLERLDAEYRSRIPPA